MGVLFFPLFNYALLCVLSSLAIILMGKRDLFALLYLPSWSLVTFIALLLFLTVPWVNLQCVIVIFPDHNYFLYSYYWSYDDEVK